jgi:hypothetical protein
MVIIERLRTPETREPLTVSGRDVRLQTVPKHEADRAEKWCNFRRGGRRSPLRAGNPAIRN